MSFAHTQLFDSTVPTVAIVDELAVSGFRLIDRSEFNPEIHQEYKEPAPKTSGKTTEKPPAA